MNKIKRAKTHSVKLDDFFAQRKARKIKILSKV